MHGRAPLLLACGVALAACRAASPTSGCTSKTAALTFAGPGQQALGPESFGPTATEFCVHLDGGVDLVAQTAPEDASTPSFATSICTADGVPLVYGAPVVDGAQAYELVRWPIVAGEDDVRLRVYTTGDTALSTTLTVSVVDPD